jgi:phenylpropionate dioxygenase-like ring-hydroxylating dioxygenase large terminal subunit
MLGQSLVLFRTEAGEAKVLDAFCPHLGAHLGHGGKVSGDCVRCPFHAWEFNGEGRCTSIPYARKLPEVPEYGNADWTDYERKRWQVRTRNQEMAENAVDSAHFHYVHGTSNMPKSEAEIRDHVLRVFSDGGMETPRGPVAGSVESLSFGFGFSTVRFKGLIETLLVSSVTPIDGDQVDVRFSFSLKKFGGGSVVIRS